jgi:hypothetical protein
MTIFLAAITIVLATIVVLLAARTPRTVVRRTDFTRRGRIPSLASRASRDRLTDILAPAVRVVSRLSD